MYRRILSLMFIGLLGATLLSGCEDDGTSNDIFENYLYQMQEFRDGFLYAQYSADRLMFVRPTKTGLKRSEIFSTPKGAILDTHFAGPTDATSHLLMVRTLPKDLRNDGAETHLTVIDTNTRASQRYALGAHITALRFSPEGRLVFGYSTDSTSGESDIALSGRDGLYNPNEIELLDLDAPPADDNPRRLSMQLGGGVLQRILFVGSMNIDGVQRNLVAFVTDGRVMLVDIDDPAFPSVTVKVKTQDDSRQVLVSKILRQPARKGQPATLFALADSFNDIFALPLRGAPDGFTVQGLNQYDGGSSPADMILLPQTSTPQLLVLNHRGQINLVHTDTGHTQRIRNVSTESGWDRIVSFEGEDGPGLLFVRDRMQSLLLCDVNKLATTPTKALRELPLNGGTFAFKMHDDTRTVLFGHAARVFALIDLRTNDIDYHYISTASDSNWTQPQALGERYYLFKQNTLAWLDLTTGQSQQMVLDAKILKVMLFARQKVGLAIHDDPLGRATLFSLDDPRRETAIVADGFFVEGIMNDEVSR